MHDFNQQITALLAQAKLNTHIYSIEECAKGGNNRTYKLSTPEGYFAVKQYFRRQDDKRDRLATEFAFLSYAKMAAPDAVPKPYSQDTEAGLALYEFVHGKPLLANEITLIDIAQASQFFCALNEARMKVNAGTLPFASEACFSIQAHLELISARIIELQKITFESQEDKAAQELITQLSLYWQHLLAKIKQCAATQKIDLLNPLPQEERCISPSDFGFHNALRMADGSIRFLDFEYAGWDDPAKMVGDFFSQLAIPVCGDFFASFVDDVSQPFSQKDNLIQRAQLLRVVYQVKWCCIALNIFLPVHLARRQFANPHLDVMMLKETQLKKAEMLVNALLT